MATFQITGPDGKKYRVQGDNPAGAMAALKKMLAQSSTPTGHNNVPDYQPPGVEGYDPATGEVTRQFGMGESAAYGAADTAAFGFGDELASYPASWATGIPREQVLSEMRGNMANAQEQNPGSFMAGQVAGGVAQGIATSPATLSARAASSSLGPRVLAGMADGAVAGSLYGAGSGEDTGSRLQEAAIGGGIGLAAGAAFPLMAAGASSAYRGFQNMRNVNPVANNAGASPDALRLLGGVLDADGSLGAAGQANMRAAGNEAMLVDAGPTARGMLDTVIQTSGPGGVVANQRVADRVGRDAAALTGALDNTLGTPQGVTAARTGIRQDTAGARSSAYNQAYSQPINYSDPRGIDIENMVRNRVPPSVVQRANALMRVDGDESRQILARIGDDGNVTFERLPDIRQLDYITRALNDLAEAGEGAGAMGGQNQLGRSYQNLSREIRDNLRELVPEYGQALETAADPIRRSQAIQLGSRLNSMARDEFAEATQGMTGPERQAVLQGFRSKLDDQMAAVTRAMSDGDMDAREALSGLKQLSSRRSRANIRSVMNDPAQADALFDEVDRITRSFELRASVAGNSRTFGRQEMNRRIDDMTAPGPLQTAMRGEPINASQRIIQAMTGQTDDAVRQASDSVRAEIADLLTRQGGAGQGVYDAINQIGQTDQATELMSSRIAALLSGQRLAYPGTALVSDNRPRM